MSGDAGEPQYANLKGVWKDTLFVRQGYTAFVRTRYQRYIGDFVLHCHILDHEDQGMMQNVRIALPDGSGGSSCAGPSLTVWRAPRRRLRRGTCE